MEAFLNVLTRGLRFVRDNPQIVYTIFLAVAISFAFFWTSEQFLSIARENQNRLENSRSSYLQDGLILLVAEHIDEPEYLKKVIGRLEFENQNMTGLRVLGRKIHPKTATATPTYLIIASLKSEEVGTEIVPLPYTELLFGQAELDTHHSYSSELYSENGRYWESVRAIPATSTADIAGFLVTDISVAQADVNAMNSIRTAYLILIVIIISILMLLARQARIIDYATLYQRLKEVDVMKDDFVSMAAHELRSPLTIIRGYAEMLGEEKGLTEKGKGSLGSIDNATKQLNALIGDILDVAKLQEGRLSFNSKIVSASEGIGSVVESFMRPAQDKGLTLLYTPSPLPNIFVDPDRFRQVLINLVGNAVKYTPKGKVEVIVTVERELLYIRVSDTGMGISAEEQQKLFQKFYRVRNKDTQDIAGTGLGLWITAQIVRAMKGTISVESIKGKGTDFIVSFPVART